MKKEKKKVLVMYTNYGTGHYKAALAIREYIMEKYKDVDVFFMDPLTLGRPFVNKVFANIGKILATRLRFLRKKIYKDKMYRNYFKKSWFYDFCIKLFFTKKVKEEILKMDPDVIISTQVGPTGVIAGHKNLFRGKLISVLTDYGIHRMFTVAHEFVDEFWVPTDKLKQEMVDLGISGKKIVVTGIPVEKKFIVNKKVDKKAYCEKWELPMERPIFLFVCGGGNGYDNALKYFSRLVELKYDFSYIFVAGKNKKLFKKAELIGDASSKFGVTLDFVDNMDELLSISDLVFGKPGGLITSEALTKKLPFIALDPIPGQETHNGKFIEDNDFGFLVNNKKDFDKLLAILSKDKKIITKWNKNVDDNFKLFKFPDIKDI